MIQVINRALNIIEYISEEPDRPHLLSEISEKIKINPATCAHIIKTLVARNYIEQANARKGYTLGPMVYHITGKESTWKELGLIAEPFMHELANELSEDVVLSIIQNNKKFIICQADGNHDIQLNREARILDDIYQTATGRLLLAFLDDKSFAALLTEYGLPGERWPECKNEKLLKQELSAIKKEKLAVASDLPNVVYIAVPIYKNADIVAALGVSIPEYRFKNSHRSKVIKSAGLCAEKISAGLNRI